MKVFQLIFSLLLIVISAYADVPNPNFGYSFNRLSGIPVAGQYQFGTKLREMHNTAICVYDFAKLGGATGTIGLKSTDLVTPCRIPGKSVIRNGFIDVTTSPLSTGAYLSVSSGASAGDLKAATLYSSLTSGRYAVIPVFATVGTYIKLTNANSIVNGVSVNAYQPTVTIATATLTAGHFRVFIDYALSE